MSASPLPTPNIRRRLASMFYDLLLLIGVFFFGFMVPNIALGVAANILLPGGILMLHAIAVTAAYFLWFWHRTGETLPMRTWKIRLVAADGSRPSWDQLVLRFMLAWPSIFLCGAGLFWALVDRDRQFLHDRLCGTRLVLTT